MNKQRLLLTIFFAVCACLLTSANAAAQATFTVINTADSGAGSLRDAVALANAAATNDTINFLIPANSAGCANNVCTITLTSGQLEITTAATAGTLTITNAGGATGIVISGNDASRVFFFNGANLTLNNVTVTRGRASTTCFVTQGNFIGGGICAVNGALTVTNSIISNNTAVGATFGGGIASSNGALTVTNSIISNNTSGLRGGGGIYNLNSTMFAVTGSTISNNSGGGINTNSALMMTNSTVSGNTNGGGISINGGGGTTVTNSTISGNSGDIAGGINNSGTLTVTNSTISNNSANISSGGGGGIRNFGTLTVTNSTISGNSATNSGGGGIVAQIADPFGGFQGTTNLSNSIVAGNTAPTAPDIQRTAVSQGYNLIGNNSGATITATTGDQIGTSANPINPRLAPLANNGGATQTRRLLFGSPAIDAGNSTLADQRSLPRPFDNPNVANAAGGNGADIGAFEVQTATAAAVSISGRVLTFDGRGLSNAIVYLTDQAGNTQAARTSTFGAYRFDNIAAGQTVVVSVVSKRYLYAPQVVSVSSAVNDLNFTSW